MFEENGGENEKEESFVKVLLDGVVGEAYNEAVRQEQKVRGLEGVRFAEKSLKEKENMFLLREQSFFQNQKRKEKIDMKDFIE